eukprot:1377646-Amphidinium_carterae.1
MMIQLSNPETQQNSERALIPGSADFWLGLQGYNAVENLCLHTLQDNGITPRIHSENQPAFDFRPAC